MFGDEIKRKLNAKDVVFPFALTMLGRKKIVISGVKRIISADENCIVAKIGSDYLKISGRYLNIVEIGGGDVYVEGEIAEICFENEK